jgi:tRNA uridine 5-carbamoylmethylation protein Kti12
MKVMGYNLFDCRSMVRNVINQEQQMEEPCEARHSSSFMIMKEISNDLKCGLTCIEEEVEGIAEVPAERNMLEEQQSSANKESEATMKSLQDTIGRFSKENENLRAKIANLEEQRQSERESVKKIINSLKETVDRISSENRMLHARIENLETKHCGKRESIGTDKVVSYQYFKTQGN